MADGAGCGGSHGADGYATGTGQTWFDFMHGDLEPPQLHPPRHRPHNVNQGHSLYRIWYTAPALYALAGKAQDRHKGRSVFGDAFI